MQNDRRIVFLANISRTQNVYLGVFKYPRSRVKEYFQNISATCNYLITPKLYNIYIQMQNGDYLDIGIETKTELSTCLRSQDYGLGTYP